MASSHPPPIKRQRVSLLSQYAKEVADLNQQGVRPGKIAELLCVQHSLPQFAITGKQVSDFIYYRKKNGLMKPHSVTATNLAADLSDSCKYFFPSKKKIK